MKFGRLECKGWQVERRDFGAAERRDFGAAERRAEPAGRLGGHSQPVVRKRGCSLVARAGIGRGRMAGDQFAR